MEQRWDIAARTPGHPAAMFTLRHQESPAAPRGTLAGTILTIITLLLGYVGVGFARLLF